MSNDAYTPAAGVHRPTRSRNENTTTTHPHVSQRTRAHHDVLVQSPGGSLCRNIVITFGMENCVTSRWWKNLEAIFIHFDRIYEHDRQTDRWTPHDGIGLGIAKQYLAGYRGNNVTSWVSTLAVITIHIAGLISCLFQVDWALCPCFTRNIINMHDHV